MTDPFHSSKYSLARAKEHVGDFKRQVGEFIKTEPYTFVVEIDPKTSEEVHKVKLSKPMPAALPGIASEAVYHLRSCLDQLIYAVILLACGKRVRNAYFPIARTQGDFENAVKGRLKEVPKEIADLIRGLKPYEGGNIPLVALNALSNTNKHAFIAPTAIVSEGDMSVKGTLCAGASVPTPIWDRTKNDMEIFRQPVGGASQVNIKLSYFVAMHDVEFVDGAPAHAVLDKFVNVVEGILIAVEAEARRLGLV
jgi:hypothetical protein